MKQQMKFATHSKTPCLTFIRFVIRSKGKTG